MKQIPPPCGIQGLCGLVIGAALLFPQVLQAASCCGGGSASSLILPKFFTQMYDLSLGYEQYHGFWNQDGVHIEDPPGSDLNQTRLTAGYGLRFAPNWQASVVLPFVWNDNQYAGIKSSTSGIGDAQLGVWYEFFDEIKCVYDVKSIEDLEPAVYLGAALTVPTGISPYDNVTNSFDITGRGFYRLDTNLILDKTVYPWTVIVNLSYGVYLERSVNREYGNFVEPYRKQLGNRTLASVSLGYTWFMEKLDTLTYTLAFSDLEEEQGEINGIKDPTSGLEKESVALTVAYATAEKDWIIKASLSHSFDKDGWGQNFPATDIFTIGVSRVIP